VSDSLTATAVLDCQIVKQSLSKLRTGQSELAGVVKDLFSWFSGHHADFARVQTRLRDERQRLAEARAALDVERQQFQATHDHDAEQFQARLAVAENERAALEVELAALRTQSAELTATLENQRRQMDEERVEWTGELRRLRRILDKQSRWLADRSPRRARMPPATGTRRRPGPARRARSWGRWHRNSNCCKRTSRGGARTTRRPASERRIASQSPGMIETHDRIEKHC